MRIDRFPAAVAAILFAACAAPASAQVVTASGRVMLSQTDGTQTPVANAMVEFQRTDVSGRWTTRTNGRGEYVHVGLPFVGTFTIAVNAPGAAPAFVARIRLSQTPHCTFVLQPGDGRQLTVEETRRPSPSPAVCR